MKNNNAQSLVETVVAVAIIMIGVVSTLTLAFATVRAGTESEARVIAVNLAREGIEVVKNIRDSNWLEIEEGNFTDSCADGGPCWDKYTHAGPSIPGGEDYSCVVYFDDINNIWKLDCGPNDFNHVNCGPTLSHDCTQLFRYKGSEQKLYGFYNHLLNEDPGNDYESVPYKRLVKANEICDDESIKEDGEKCDVKVGIQIISEVRWFEEDRERSTILEDRVYNWKMEALDDSWH